MQYVKRINYLACWCTVHTHTHRRAYYSAYTNDADCNEKCMEHIALHSLNQRVMMESCVDNEFRCIICLHDFPVIQQGVVNFGARRRLNLFECTRVCKTCACAIRRRERAFERAKKQRLSQIIRDSISGLVSSSYIDYEITHIVLRSGEELGSDFHEELRDTVANRIRSESENWFTGLLDYEDSLSGPVEQHRSETEDSRMVTESGFVVPLGFDTWYQD